MSHLVTFENVSVVQLSVLPDVLVGTWSVILKEEYRLRVAEKMC